LSKRIIDVKTNRSDNRINTTLGELIATVSEFAFEYSADTREAYELARLALVESAYTHHACYVIGESGQRHLSACASPLGADALFDPTGGRTTNRAKRTCAD
jgi:hypothetical protein